MTTSSEPALLDTNILVYAYDSHDSRNEECRKLLAMGVSGARNLCIAPQVLFEFIAVVTAPSQVTRPVSMEEG